MKKKIKISLILSLAIIFGCFSNVFAATNQNNKIKKIAEVKKSVRLLDNTNDNGFDQYTKLLMHMDDGTFKDEYGHTITNHGVTLDTTNKEFGNGSAYFDGSSNMFVGASPDFDFATNDYTIDFWFKLNSIKQDQYFTDMEEGNKLAIEYLDNSFRYIVNEKEIVIAPVSYKLQTSTWYHLALVRHSNDVHLFINGKNIGNGISSSNHGSPSSGLYLGDIGGHSVYRINGNMDEFRISNVARWTSDFTPQTTPYGNVLATGISLNKTTDSLIKGQSDNTLTATVTPDNASNKTVRWASSDPTIVSVDSTTGVITASKDKVGTAIITATIDGTNLTKSCVVTVTDQQPTNPTDSSDKAVLNITMTNGQVKQYNVTMDTVNKFITWYKLRSAGSGDPFYEFNITQTSNPSIVKNDYVVFDKISSFEVDDYTK